MSSQFSTFCGIDISKEWMDIAIDKQVRRVAQEKRAILKFVKESHLPVEQTLVVMESTGGYERLAARCFEGLGFSVHIAHPNKVRAFAQARGCRAKSDALDAVLLADYGAFILPEEIRSLPDPVNETLHSLSRRLVQLKILHHQEECRLGTASVAVRSSHRSLLRLLDRQINQLEQKMDSLIHSEELLHARYERLRTMVGVGPCLGRSLVTRLPELGHVNKKVIASLVGVAPITKESGKQRSRAKIQYGRSDLRKVLYMGALTAIRYDARMKAVYERLLCLGKAKKVCIVAVMRKMLVTLNAMLTHSQDYRVEYSR